VAEAIKCQRQVFGAHKASAANIPSKSEPIEVEARLHDVRHKAVSFDFASAPAGQISSDGNPARRLGPSPKPQNPERPCYRERDRARGCQIVRIREAALPTVLSPQQ